MSTAGSIMPALMIDDLPGKHERYDYNFLPINSSAAASDSWMLPEETNFFASVGELFPEVRIRISTEHLEAPCKVCFLLVDISEKRLLQATYRDGDRKIDSFPRLLDRRSASLCARCSRPFFITAVW